MPKTACMITTSQARIGDNVFFLISAAYNSLRTNGESALAEEMQKKIDTEANSPDDVLKIVKEYVRVV